MKLQDKSYAGQTLAVAGGMVLVDADGNCEVDDATGKQLAAIGFKSAFRKDVKLEPVAPAVIQTEVTDEDKGQTDDEDERTYDEDKSVEAAEEAPDEEEPASEPATSDAPDKTFKKNPGRGRTGKKG